MEFNNITTGPFAEIINQHNANIANLDAARDLLGTKAEKLAALLYRDFPISAGVRGYWHDRPNGTAEGTTGHIAKVFKDQNDASTNLGNARVFDPWDGRWRGNWCNVSQAWPQYHIWDRTRATSDGYHVQPVTQRGLGNTGRCNVLPTDSTQFVGAGDLRAAWRAGTVNLAINVWHDSHHITGWVVKKENGGDKILPHLGYRLNGHTLIWITRQYDVSDSGQYDMTTPGTFWMFFEWIGQDRDVYGIHGRSFTLAALDQATPASQPIGYTRRYVRERSHVPSH